MAVVLADLGQYAADVHAVTAVVERLGWVDIARVVATQIRISVAFPERLT